MILSFYKNDATSQDDIIKIGIGIPILEFNFSDLAKNDKIKIYKEILKSWIETDQFNINKRNQLQQIHMNYKDYKTNCLPQEIVFSGNYT